MEVRKRAAKNVGKMSFTELDLQRLLFAYGDIQNPLPETAKVLDELLTDFIQGIAFEAARVAHYSGRQKIKLDDFQFIFRKNPLFLGKLRETFEKKQAIDLARKLFNDDDEALRDAAAEETKGKGKGKTEASAAPPAPAASGAGAANSTTGSGAGRPAEEELGAADDDAEAEADMLGRPA